jgi:hypothetical protein
VPSRWYNKASVQTALVSGVFFVVVTLVLQFSPKTSLEKEVAALQGEVTRLETELSPFRALAVQRFGGTEHEALAKLAAQLRDLQTQFERAAGAIRGFDVAAAVTLTGDGKSTTPPNFSTYFGRPPGDRIFACNSRH